VTLRQALGNHAHRIHALVEELLDREDSVIVLVDGRRAITYGAGSGLSPCQQELASVDIERTVRALAATPSSAARGERSRPSPLSERAVDEAIAESFPASDPPAWNPGLARPAARPAADVTGLPPRIPDSASADGRPTR
jgi:hypothetical protein